MSSIDWDTLSKFIPLIVPISQFVLAWIAYSIWKNQKAKEVIAVAAKELLLNDMEVFEKITAVNNLEDLKKIRKDVMNYHNSIRLFIHLIKAEEHKTLIDNMSKCYKFLYKKSTRFTEDDCSKDIVDNFNNQRFPYKYEYISLLSKYMKYEI